MKTFTSTVCLIFEAIWLLLLVIPSVVVSLVNKIFFTFEKDLKGKIVLVTGGGNGLGKEIALQLSKEGCVVISVDVREEDNQNTIKEIIENQGFGKSYCCDVSDSLKTKALSEAVMDEFGKVDILINNAGLIFGNEVLQGTDEEIVKVLNVNLLSSIWMVRAFLPHMINKNEGHIVCIASAAGIHSLAEGNIYSCSKFALVGMVYSMIEEFRKNSNREKIKISCALPYFINTNKLYSEHWNLRLPALTTKKAASLVIKGIKREYKFYTVPWLSFGYTISSLIRTLPPNLYYLFRDRFYTNFSFQLAKQTKM